MLHLLERLSPICSSRGAGLKSRISFFGISSILPRGVHRIVCGCVGSDRALLVRMTWLWPSLLGLSRVVQCPTRSCAGIAQGLGPLALENLALSQGGPQLAVSCANSSGG
jgi:hypothetical protein